MFKRLALLSFLVAQTSLLMAQKNTVSIHGSGDDIKYSKDSTASLYGNHTSGITKPSRDFVMLQLGYNTWLNKPDSIKLKTIGYVFNAYLCYDFPIKKSKLSFATGIGINTSVVYLDKERIANQDTGAYGSQAHFFKDSVNPAKRYKFNTTYLQAPFELRYFSNTINRNRGFKAAVGLTVGAFLGAHSKELISVGGTNIKEKENTKRYMSPWNFALTGRIGLGNFALFGSYNLTTVFKEANGPAATPFSMGLCVTGL